MPKKDVPLAGEDSVPRPCCSKCGEWLRRTSSVEVRLVEVADVRQELWICPVGHEFWRTKDFDVDDHYRNDRLW